MTDDQVCMYILGGLITTVVIMVIPLRDCKLLIQDVCTMLKIMSRYVRMCVDVYVL